MPLGNTKLKQEFLYHVQQAWTLAVKVQKIAGSFTNLVDNWNLVWLIFYQQNIRVLLLFQSQLLQQ